MTIPEVLASIRIPTETFGSCRYAFRCTQWLVILGDGLCAGCYDKGSDTEEEATAKAAAKAIANAAAKRRRRLLTRLLKALIYRMEGPPGSVTMSRAQAKAEVIARIRHAFSLILAED